MDDYISIKNYPSNIPIMEVDKNFNYQQKTVSSTGNEMLVEFVTDQELTNQGFHAKFHYVPINPDCKSWLGSQYLISEIR